MSGTYSVVSSETVGRKYKAYVKFNSDLYPDFYSATLADGSPMYPDGGEYYEIDLDGPFPEGLFPEEASDEEKVAAVLQLVADQDAL